MPQLEYPELEDAVVRFDTGLGSPARFRRVRDKAREYRTLEDFGAVGDGVRLLDGGAITASSTTYTNAGAAFAVADVGKKILVAGAGTAGADLVTTISAYTSSTEVELANAAATTVSGAATCYGTDDSAAFQEAFDSAPGEVHARTGRIYCVNAIVHLGSECVISGATIMHVGTQGNGIFRAVSIDGTTYPPRDLYRFGFERCRFLRDSWLSGLAWIVLTNVGYASYHFRAVGNEVIANHEYVAAETIDNRFIVGRGIRYFRINENFIDGPIQLVFGPANYHAEDGECSRNILLNCMANPISFAAGWSSGDAARRTRLKINNNIIVGNATLTSVGIFVGLDGEGGKGGPARPVWIEDVELHNNTIVLERAGAKGILISLGVDQSSPAVASVCKRLSIKNNSGSAETFIHCRIDGDGASIPENCEIAGNLSSGQIMLDIGGWRIMNPTGNRLLLREQGGRYLVQGGSLASVESTDTSIEVRCFDVLFERAGGGSNTRFFDLDADAEGVAMTLTAVDCRFGNTDGSGSNLKMGRIRGASGTTDVTIIRPVEFTAWQSGTRWALEDGQPEPTVTDPISLA